MREILFRGKRKLGNQWIEGSLHTEKFTDDEEYLCCEVCQCDVYPETVGQYTGLTDKNGTKIFEGDIVKHYHDRKFPESYSKGYIFWDKEYLSWKRTSENVNCCIANDCIYEVIGNIHDNPELLESGGEG